jgi:glycine cleavage system aminomethyltransferase T/glycine/D-amino acid oxidase-like deaminating enzyme
MTKKLPAAARIVIVGGGALGTSIAYQLAKRGERDVVLLEKAQLTHGCTWHAAGLVGQLRGKKTLTRLMQNSVAVFDALEAETGQATDWKKVGSLRLAASPERWSEIRRSMQLAKSFGFECHDVTPADAKRMFPWIDISGVVGAAFIPSDGYIDPYAVTMAFAAGARKHGVSIHEGVCVTGFEKVDRRITGVVTDQGTIACEVVVNAAGLWAKRVGVMAGVALATGIVEHQYFLTEKKLTLPPGLTTLRDPDRNFYLKPDVGSFAIGGWEDGSRGFHRGMPPLEFGRELFEPNLDRLALFAEPAATRLPVLNEIGIQRIVNGPIPVSADGEPIMGLAPELDNFYVACGFTAGIAASGGAGIAMAGWILDGDPGMDLWPLDVRRFSAIQAHGRVLEERAIEAYGAYYKVHWPAEEAHAARGLRRSPVHERLAAAGAVFGSKNGWERPNWFRTSDAAATDTPSFEGVPGWHRAVAAEHRAIRERVALVDQSSFAKFRISGPDAARELQRIAANDVGVGHRFGNVGARPASPSVPHTQGAEQVESRARHASPLQSHAGAPYQTVYTQFCNAQGGIEADVTLIRLADDEFHLVTGSGFGIRDSGWIRQNLAAGARVRIDEVTNAFAVLNLVGPRARDVLASVTDEDVSNAALPYLSARWLEVGHGRVLAARIGYVGELGYELTVPVEQAAQVADVLWQAGQAHGIANAGYRAIDSCRLEKGYLYWSGDIGPDTTPLEAGLGFAVNFAKPDFIGRDALLRAKAAGPSRRLVTLSVDGFAPFHGGETVLADGQPVSQTASCGFGHTLGRTIAFAYLPNDAPAAAHWEVEAFGRRWPATRGGRCLYDPKGERLKA